MNVIEFLQTEVQYEVNQENTLVRALLNSAEGYTVLKTYYRYRG